MLKAISPIDGRYAAKTQPLSEYFSEYALIRYRVLVEVKYFSALCQSGIPQLAHINPEDLKKIDQLVSDFGLEEAEEIKEIEKTTNHDVKAVEYFLKKQFEKIGLNEVSEFIHFGLTSQDINNTATPLMLKEALDGVYYPSLEGLVAHLSTFAEEWKSIPMLARTHGQPASPTLLGKEMMVYVERLFAQLLLLKQVPITAKFGGATGNMNAHFVAFPQKDWLAFANNFVQEKLELSRLHYTTQIAHYDNLAAIFMGMKRINTILIDFCRDIWTYISMDYFKQKVEAGEIGSSAMPHKVNPIDFENAEGNLGLANASFTHLADKLPISRLQRDLTDSTVLRNIGVPMAHTMIALKSIQKGMGKLLLNQPKLEEDLEDNWMVVAEAIQNVLRRESFPKPYEALLTLTRGKGPISQTEIHSFIDGLDISNEVKAELKAITPHNYVGKN
ncbi:MAG: adenylosuccinate lyase [Saprospiraceae bacterium]|nr:adenylosuccinate lyase [Saprospiraceae bacterium]